MATSEANRPVPGMWWSTLAHAQAGQRFFITKNEPHIDFYEGSLAAVRADENLIVVPFDGFHLFWKYYHPKEGESVSIPEWEEIRKLNAVSAGGNAPETNSGEIPPATGATE